MSPEEACKTECRLLHGDLDDTASDIGAVMMRVRSVQLLCEISCVRVFPNE